MKNTQWLHKLCTIVLVLCMLVQFVPVAARAEQPDDVTFTKVENNEVTASLLEEEEHPEELLTSDYSDSEVVRVSILLESPSTIDKGYSTRNISRNAGAMAYRSQMLNEQAVIENAIEQKIGSNLDVEWNLALITNAICANVEYGQIEQIKQVDGVQDVIVDQIYYPDVVEVHDGPQTNMVFSTEMVNANEVWNTGYTGAGMRIAIIDTGLDTDHQSVSEGGYLTAMRQNAGDQYIYDYMETLNLLDKDEIRGILPQLNAYSRGGSDASKLYINAKIPFGFNYSENSYDVTHDNDSAGAHGSHVAGIAAANRYVPKGNGFTNALDEVMVTGTAPDAQILVLKVFGSNGAAGWDILCAVEDAILLGADTINLSLGSVAPGFAKNNSLGAVLEKLKNTDTVVAISAGNNYDWAYLSKPGTLYADDVNTFTGGDPGSAPNALTIASVENSGKIISGSMTVGGQMVGFNETSTLSNNPNYTPIMGMDITSDGSGTEYEYIYFDHYSYANSYEGYEDLVKGKVVLCSRGDNSFSDKANNAVEAGAIAVIIYNNVAGSINMDLSEFKYKVPCVSITKEAAQKFVAQGEKAVGPDGEEYYTGTMKIAKGKTKIPAVEGAANEMSVFSSWGVTGDLALKPELTAPGGYVYSIDGSSKTSTSKYTTMSGTSMAAPQVAGIGALVQQAIADKGYKATSFANATRGLTQSLLMSTAVPMKDANGNYYPVIQQGAGLVDAQAATAADSYIKMNKNASRSYDDGKVKAELGDDPERRGVYSFNFTINNLDGQERTYDLSADVFAQDSYEAAARVGDNEAKNYKTYYMDRNTTSLGATTTFSARAVTVPAGGSANVKVTIALDASAKSYLEERFCNGTYVQAYIFAKPRTTEEGLVGVTHSIPMLAFYGNWTDAPMFYGVSTKEGQAYMNYSLPATTDDSRWPYFTWDDGYGGTVKLWNRFQITSATGTFNLGSNPLTPDDTYMPERNAVNDKINYVYAQTWLARNAAKWRFTVQDLDTKEYIAAYQTADNIYGAYLNNSGYSIGSFGCTESMTSVPEEGHTLEFCVRALPEYYEDGSLGEDSEPGEGAYVRNQAIVDNTCPDVADIKYYATDKLLKVTASDKNYISAVVLYNSTGDKVLTFDGAKQEIQPGEVATYELDLAGITGTEFFVQVFDYALNMATYRVRIGDGNMELFGAAIAFDQDTGKWVRVDKAIENLQNLTDPDVTYNAATAVGDVIFAVTSENNLYAVSAITLQDAKLVANLNHSVADMAYNAEDEMLYGVTDENKLLKIDPATGATEMLGAIPVQTNTLACDAKGTFYCNKYGTGEIYGFTLDAVSSGVSENYDFNGDNTVNALDSQLLLDFVTGTVKTINNQENGDVDSDGDVDTYDVYKLQQMIAYYPKQIAVAEGIISKYLQSMECDPNNGLLYWASYFTDQMAGKEMGFSIYCEIDPASGHVTKYSDFWHPLTALVILDKELSKTLPPAGGVKNLVLSRATAAVEKGEEIKLDAAVAPWNTTDDGIVWTSSDESIATVDASGVVTAVADGVCKITATSTVDGSISATCTVTVGEAENTATAAEVCTAATPDNTEKAAYLAAQQTQTTVQLELTAKETTTNGLQTVSFEANQLELTDVVCSGLYSYTVSGDLGTIGFVPAETTETGDTLAILNFKVKDGSKSADVLVRELQRNNEHLDDKSAVSLKGHVWSEWSQTTVPTCGNAGEETRSCSDCGEKQTRAVSATGEHSWSEWEQTKPSTDVEQGERIRTCSACGATEKSATHIEGIHVWGDWNVKQEPTCGAEGEKTTACTECGAPLTLTIPATGQHSWSDWWENGDGTRSRACSGCGESQSKVIVDGREGTAVEELFNYFAIGKNYVSDVQITGAEVVSVTLLDSEPETGETDRLHYLIELSRSADEVDSVHAKFRVSNQVASGYGSAFIDTKQGSVGWEGDVTDYDIDISSGTGSMTAWSYWDSSKCMAVKLEFVVGENTTPYTNPEHVYGGDGYVDSLKVWHVKVEKATSFISAPLDYSTGNQGVTVCIWLAPSTPDDATVGLQFYGTGSNKLLPEGWTSSGGYVKLQNGEARIDGIRYAAIGHQGQFYRTDYTIILKNNHESYTPELLQGNEINLLAEKKIPFSVDFRDYFADRNGDELTYSVSVDGGEVKEQTSSKYRYTPKTDDQRVLTVTASDGTLTSETLTITIQPTDKHVWREWQVTKEVTCTTDGEAKRTCSCGATETSVIPALGEHTWTQWEDVRNAKDQLTGAQLRQCLVCGEYERTGVLLGDVNGDGNVNMQDATILSRYLADWNVEPDLAAADVNVDGKVDMQDVTLLRRYLAGWDVTFGPQ